MFSIEAHAVIGMEPLLACIANRINCHSCSINFARVSPTTDAFLVCSIPGNRERVTPKEPELLVSVDAEVTESRKTASELDRTGLISIGDVDLNK